MAACIISPAARRDLRAAIDDRLEQAGIHAARNLRNAFERALAHLAEHPQLGRLRPDLSEQPYRFFPTAGFIIVYRESPVEIIRVIDGRRDLAALLVPPPPR